MKEKKVIVPLPGGKYCVFIARESGAQNFFEDAYGFSSDKGVLGNTGTALGYISAGVNAYNTLKKDIGEGRSGTYAVADVAVGAGIDLGKMALSTGCTKVGAAIGTAIPVPVVGTIVGTSIGFGVGCIATKTIEKIVTDKKRESLATGVERGVGWTRDRLNDAKERVRGVSGTALGILSGKPLDSG